MPEPLALPRLHYIIAANMRTGSSLLCERLTQVGIAGTPGEYFGAKQHDRWTRRWKLPRGLPFADYLREVLTRTRTPNGVAGIKLHAHQMQVLRDRLRDEGLGGWRRTWPQPITYIHLRREDTLAQAISLYRAETSGEWFRLARTSDRLDGPRPVFDAAGIRRCQRRLERSRRLWEEYAIRWQLPLLTLTYETMIADMPAALRQVLTWLDLDPAAVEGLPTPRLAQQADRISADWYARMQAEGGAP